MTEITNIVYTVPRHEPPTDADLTAIEQSGNGDWIPRLVAEIRRLRGEIETLRNKKCVHELAREWAGSLHRPYNDIEAATKIDP